METAGEGGAWGMALLAQYLNYEADMTLSEYLDNKIFKQMDQSTIKPTEESIMGYQKYVDDYSLALEVERVAIDNFKGD